LEQELVESRAGVPRLAEELANEKEHYRDALLNKEREIDELHAKLSAALASEPKGSTGPPGSALARAPGRSSTPRKIGQDGEQRCRMRQAGMEKGGDAAGARGGEGARALGDKDMTISRLRDELSGEKSRITDLQKQLQDARSAPPPMAARPPSSSSMPAV